MGAHVREQESYAGVPFDLGACHQAPPLPSDDDAGQRQGMVDGKLLRLGWKFRRRHEEWLNLWMACHAKEKARDEASLASGEFDMEVYAALTDAFGFTAANAVHEELSSLVEQILAEPAKSPLGLQVKARVIFHEMFLPSEHTGIPEEDEDWCVKLMRQLIRELGEISTEAGPVMFDDAALEDAGEAAVQAPPAISERASSPVLHLVDEWYRTRFMVNTAAASIDDAEADKLIDRAEEIEDFLKGRKPATIDEAVAYIGLAKIGIWRELVGGSGSFSYAMFEALLDGAADLLRAHAQPN